MKPTLWAVVGGLVSAALCQTAPKTNETPGDDVFKAKAFVAESFVLVGSNGVPLGALIAKEHGASFSVGSDTDGPVIRMDVDERSKSARILLLDGDHRSRAVINLIDGSASIGVVAEDLNQGAWLRSEGQSAIVCTQNSSDRSGVFIGQKSVFLNDRDGRNRMGLLVAEDGGLIKATDAKGVERLRLICANEYTGMYLFDGQGRLRVKALEGDGVAQVAVETPSGTEGDAASLVSTDKGVCGFQVKTRDGKENGLFP